MTAQAKMAEVQHKVQGGENKQTNPEELQIEMMKEQNKANEIEMKAMDAQMDNLNRQRDRESRERLAAVKLAEEVMKDPMQGMAVVRDLISPSMLQRLEANEAPAVQPQRLNG